MILLNLLYLVGAVLFILSLRGLSSARSSQKGIILGILGTIIAIIATLFKCDIESFYLIFSAIAIGGTVGIIIAKRTEIASLPQLVAAFHSLVGLSAVFIASSVFYSPEVFGVGTVSFFNKVALIEIALGAVIGAVTFTGSVVAFLKLQNFLKPNFVLWGNAFYICLVLAMVLLSGLVWFFLTANSLPFWLLVVASFVLGCYMIMPIGGSDMPVVISMLNSYSGWAAAATGFSLNNQLLIITGALVGSSGAILVYIMCKNMNRSIGEVIFGGLINRKENVTYKTQSEKNVKVIGAEDAAFILSNAASVIIVPGFGMAVAHAQWVICEISNFLKSLGVRVRYAIHPVAGRMPGHMNVLLAEAKVSYEDIFELDDINCDFASTDVALVIGANDITNPAAYEDPHSPIFGMPVLDVSKAGVTLFIKRSLDAGYSGIDNSLFYRDNTMMVLGDAKKVCEHILKSLN